MPIRLLRSRVRLILWISAQIALAALRYLAAGSLLASRLERISNLDPGGRSRSSRLRRPSPRTLGATAVFLVGRDPARGWVAMHHAGRPRGLDSGLMGR